MTDMTQGSIKKHLIRYAVPMILGNVMQLTYNAVDSIIIGKSLGEDALAAVSSSNPIMTVMILGASGLGIGASVLMSKFYGAKEYDTLKKEFSTTVIFSTIFSLVVFMVGFLLSGHILSWIHTPAEAYSMALVYLRIIFVGFLFTFQYNILSSSMRALGDSKTPVWFLGISCVINIMLDLILVMGLGLGVVGAGLATVFAEMISVVFCIIWIQKKMPFLRLRASEYVVDYDLLKQTLKNGSLTALQQAAQPVGKVLIQSVINAQGVVAIGAFNAVCRVDDFACIPAQSIGSGIMTCTAQNRGAGDGKRVRASFRSGLGVALGYFPIICLITLLFKRPFVSLLTPAGSEQMIHMGVAYLAIKAWLFVMPCITNAIQGYFRGMGRLSIVLFATVLQISIRTICVFFWVPKIGIVGEAYGCFMGWGCMIIFELTYLLIHRKKMWFNPEG